MNGNLFECSVRYEKVMENGANKKVNEPYLVDALSFTEAEARITEEMSTYISGEFSVSAVRIRKFAEVFLSENEVNDTFYKVKISVITLDEKSGSEKRTKLSFLIQSSSIYNALKEFDEKMKGTMIDYTITSIEETNIMDVYTYEPNNNQ